MNTRENWTKYGCKFDLGGNSARSGCLPCTDCGSSDFQTMKCLRRYDAPRNRTDCRFACWCIFCNGSCSCCARSKVYRWVLNDRLKPIFSWDLPSAVSPLHKFSWLALVTTLNWLEFSFLKICCACQRNESRTRHNRTSRFKRNACCDRCKRLTDAFTKLLMPGTSMREINDCVISKKRFMSIDRRWVVLHTSYAPIR